MTPVLLVVLPLLAFRYLLAPYPVSLIFTNIFFKIRPSLTTPEEGLETKHLFGNHKF